LNPKEHPFNHTDFYMKFIFFNLPLSCILLREKFVDTKGVIRSHKSKKARQYHGQKKMTNNGLQRVHGTLKTEQHERH
jgi:hypothetical protein